MNYFPEHFQFYTTSNCQLACNFCPKSRQTIPEISMDMDRFKELADNVIPRGVRTVELSPCVGDPLLDKFLISRIEYLQQYNLDKILFFTNGVALTQKKLLSLLRFSNVRMVLSIYGYDTDSWVSVTQADKSHYFRLNANLKTLANTLTQTNSSLVERIDLRFPNAKLPTGGNIGLAAKSSIYRELYRLVYSDLVDIKQVVDASENANWCSILKDDFEPGPCSYDPSRKGMCRNAIEDNGIFPDGSITMCHWFDLNKKLILGTIDDLDSIYQNGGIFHTIYQEQENGIYRSICRGCTGWQPRLTINRRYSDIPKASHGYEVDRKSVV